MAKKNEDQTLTKADVLAALEARGSKGGARLKNRKYAIKSEWTQEELQAALADTRPGPQMRQCIGVILGAAEEKPEIMEQELFNLFNTDEVTAKFAGSKQTAWDVYKYYSKKIIEAGFLTEIA